MILMPCAPRRIAFCIARFIARRNMIRFSSCCAIESAIANAEHNDGADIDELKVKSICVDKADSLRRFTARAKGRGNVILKQTCHIHVVVGDGK